MCTINFSAIQNINISTKYLNFEIYFIVFMFLLHESYVRWPEKPNQIKSLRNQIEHLIEII